MPPKAKKKSGKKQAERFLKISGLSLKVGSSYLTQKLMESFAKAEDREPDRLETHLRNARRITTTMGEMKGTMMKLGQMLSLNAEFLPKEFTHILSSLHSQAPAVGFDLIQAQVEAELGKPLREVFRDFSPTPVAAASIGQVHRATLKDGRDVVVKVQYPDVEDEVEGDLRNIKLLLTTLKPLGGGLDLTHLMKELRDRMVEELDYERERASAEFFRDLYKDVPAVRIPRSLPEFSSRRVLTLEYLPGQPLSEFCEKETSGTQRNRIGEALMRFYFHQLFRHGLLHADPNPGNFAVTVEKGEASLIVYDFGCIKKFPRAFMATYKNLLRDYLAGKTSGIAEGLEKLGLQNLSGVDYPQEFYEAFAKVFMEPFLHEPYSFGDSHLQEKSVTLARTQMREVLGFKPPRHILFHNRVLVGTYNNLIRLKAVGYWRSILQEYLTHEEKSPSRVSDAQR